MPREAEAPDGDRPQLLRASSSLWTQNRERNATPRPRFTASLMAALLPSSSETFKLGERPTGPLKALLQGTAGAGTRLADDERFAGQGVERDASTSRPGMPRGDEEHEGIAADRASLEGRFLGLLPDESERCPALLDILDDRAAIAHRGPHMDPGYSAWKAESRAGRKHSPGTELAAIGRSPETDG